MERLTEERQIYSPMIDRGIFNVAETILEISTTMFPSEVGPEFDHFFGVVDSDHLFRTSGEQLRQGAFARAQIRDHHRWQKSEQRVRQRLPGPPGNVGAPELTG